MCSFDWVLPYGLLCKQMQQKLCNEFCQNTIEIVVFVMHQKLHTYIKCQKSLNESLALAQSSHMAKACWKRWDFSCFLVL